MLEKFCFTTMNDLVLLPLAAFLVSICLHFAAMKFFPVLGLMDFPERYGLKRARIPYPTGVLSVLTFLLFYAAFFILDIKALGVIVAVLLLCLTAFIDDRTPLPFWIRLLIQLAAAFVLFATGSRIYTITSPFGGFLKLDDQVIHLPLVGSLPIMSGLFTLIWLGLTVNALNWFDGIPGQVSILSTIGFGLLGWLALVRDSQPEVALLCFILANIALAATAFDFPPAKVLMGDTGSMFFGLMLGLIGIYHGGKVATAFLVLAIPLLDALFVVIRRIINGSSPFKGGHDHLHHRLLAKGWSARRIVVSTAVLSGIFGFTALFLTTVGKGIEIAILIVLMLSFTRYSTKK